MGRGLLLRDATLYTKAFYMYSIGDVLFEQRYWTSVENREKVQCGCLRRDRLAVQMFPEQGSSKIAEGATSYKQQGQDMVLGGSGKVSFGRRIREDRIQAFRVSYIHILKS